MGLSVEKAYAKGLLDSFQSDERLEEVTGEIESFLPIFATSGLRNILTNPGLTKSEKEQILQEAFSLSPEKDAELMGLFRVVLEKQREDFLIGILNEFRALSYEKLKIAPVKICSAKPLSDQNKEKIESKLRETTSYRQLRFEYVEDASLIGGIVIFLNGHMVDGSIKGKLREMKRTLKDVKLS